MMSGDATSGGRLDRPTSVLCTLRHQPVAVTTTIIAQLRNAEEG